MWTKAARGLGLGKISLRNHALLGKWLRRFPKERNDLWHKVITNIYGHIQMDKMLIWWLDGDADVLGK